MVQQHTINQTKPPLDQWAYVSFAKRLMEEEKSESCKTMDKF